MQNFYLNNTYIEYDLTQNSPKKRKALVFLLGLPGGPKDYPVFSDFKNAGYDIFLPIYEGTWKSKGIFLEKNPVEAINELITAISSGLDLNATSKYQSKDIYILGTSFGGGVALSLNDSPELVSICALSPVISFMQTVGIETLGSYLSSEQKENYRFNTSRWQDLITDSIFSPQNKMTLKPDKILLLAGKKDDQIHSNDIVKFAEQNNIEYKIFDDLGHITFSKIRPDILSIITDFFGK